jgi:hypothetical protein
MGAALSGNQWTATKTKNGIRNISCESWEGYVDFLNGTLLDYRNYVFRGHASDSWQLEPTLARALTGIKTSKEEAIQRHLENFKYATRGRRGHNPPALKSEDEWWALGQHHGLATPLLDWSESPYVAAYFAFHTAHEHESEHRVVFALSTNSVRKKAKELEEDGRIKEAIRFVRPLSDENPRLITQRGLFTHIPSGESIDRWIAKHFAGNTSGAKLLRIQIPSSHRFAAMKSLNRMNVNHLSLFPDLYGAAKYCNHDLQIEKY